MVDTQALQEQIEYYRARAAEYDEWFFRAGRYDRGAEHRSAWNDEIAQVEHALDKELAGGTFWSWHVARDYGHDIWRARMIAS